MTAARASRYIVKLMLAASDKRTRRKLDKHRESEVHLANDKLATPIYSM